MPKKAFLYNGLFVSLRKRSGLFILMETKRICIYPKDIQRITGRSERYGRALIAKIKEEYKKEEHQFVTVEEFCRYTGLATEQVYPLITG